MLSNTVKGRLRPMRAIKLDAGFHGDPGRDPESQALHSLTLPAPLHRHGRRAGTLRFNPDFVLEHQGFRVSLLGHETELQRQTTALITRMYTSRGLSSYVHSHELDTARSTIIACRRAEVVGTLSLGLDNGQGLMAEVLYPEEIASVRQGGGRVCEITRLAMDPKSGSQDALAGMVQILYVLITMVHDMTDIFIEVHPRHAGFYQHLLGYRIVGPQRICPRVNAPAVLLHLQRHRLDALIGHFADNPETGAHSFYRLFPTPDELRLLHFELMQG